MIKETTPSSCPSSKVIGQQVKWLIVANSSDRGDYCENSHTILEGEVKEVLLQIASEYSYEIDEDEGELDVNEMINNIGLSNGDGCANIILLMDMDTMEILISN